MYVRLLKRMWAVGVLRVGGGPPLAEAWLFAVQKKTGRQPRLGLLTWGFLVYQPRGGLMWKYAVNGQLFPQLNVLPMGWAHAPVWSQRSQTRLLTQEFQTGQLLSDLRAVGSLEDGLISIWTTWGGAFTGGKRRCRELTGAALRSVLRVGLEAHEVDLGVGLRSAVRY